MPLSLVMDDTLLLARYARTRDSDAFAQLVARHAGLVYGVCTRVLRDRAAAEDAAQDSFLALAQHAGSIRSSLSAWLHRVALHAALRHRRHPREAQLVEEVAAVEPAQREAWRRLSPLLDAALADLPEEARALIAERYLEGNAQEAIAARRGVSQATISRRLQAGVDQLRTRLAMAMDEALFSSVLPLAVTEAPGHLLTQLGKLGLAGVGAPTTGAGTGIGLGKVVCIAALVGMAAAGATMVVLRQSPATPPNPHRVAAAAPAAAPPPAPTPASAPPAPGAALPVTITVHQWPLDRVVETLNDQLPWPTGTRIELLPTPLLPYPHIDAVADHEAVGQVLQRVATAAGWRLRSIGGAWVLDHPVQVVAPAVGRDAASAHYELQVLDAAGPAAPVLGRAVWPMAPGDPPTLEGATQRLAQEVLSPPHGTMPPHVPMCFPCGDATLDADLLATLNGQAARVAEASQPARLRAWQVQVLEGLMGAAGTWEAWMPPQTPLVALRAEPPAVAGLIASWRRCQRLHWPILPSQCYLAAVLDARALVPDLIALVQDPTSVLPGYQTGMPLQQLTAQVLRGHAIHALGRLGGDAAAAFLREQLQAHPWDPCRVQMIAALGECGTASDADLLLRQPRAGSWYLGTTLDVALMRLAPARRHELATAGAAAWGEGDAAIAFPTADSATRLLAGLTSGGWWMRWAAWKGTAQLPAATVADALAAARSAHALAPLLLDTFAARAGDDAALSRVVATWARAPAPLCDDLARSVENVPQQLAARLSATRQQAALAQLQSLTHGEVPGDAALSFLGCDAGSERVAAMVRSWERTPTLRPALVHALCTAGSPEAIAFVVRQLTAAAAGATQDGQRLLQALDVADAVDAPLREQLLPLLIQDRPGALWLASAGLAAFPDTADAVVQCLHRHLAAIDHDLIGRLRVNRPLGGTARVAALMPVWEELARAGHTAQVRREAIDALWEDVSCFGGATRRTALETTIAACGDADPGVSTMARQVVAKLRRPSPDQSNAFYEEQAELQGSLDDWDASQRFDHLAQTAPAPPAAPTTPPARASGF